MNIKKFFKIISLFLSICLVILAGVYAASFFMSGGFSGKGPNAMEEIVDKRINVLLMATDADGLLTDTIMLASFDSKNEKLSVVSIPRDTRVKIGNSWQKINAAYSLGEEGKRQEKSMKVIKEITGLPIHYYAVIQPKGFINVIDLLGGVNFDVPDVEGDGRGMNYDDPTQNLHIHLKPGKQLLDGQKSHDFMRYRNNTNYTRGYPEGDIGRIKAQQTFVKAFIEQKAKPEYFLKINSIYKEIVKNLNTNVKTEDLATLLPLIKLVKAENTKTFQLPGEPQMINGGSYYIYDKVKTEELISTEILGNIAGSPAPSASPKSR